MSAVVQLSYSINDKLRLDDHSFPTFEAHHKAEAQAAPVSKSTSFTAAEPCGQWTVPPVVDPATFIASTVTTASTSCTSSSKSVGASKSGVGVLSQKFEHHKTFHRKDMKPVALVRTSANDGDTSQTTVFDLRDWNSQKFDEKRFTNFNLSKIDRLQVSKILPTVPTTIEEHDRRKQSTSNEAQSNDTFLSVIGQSCTLFHSKQSNAGALNSTIFTDVPPNKKHCRSVSEPDDLVNAFKITQSPSTSWKPDGPSHIWAPIRRYNIHSRRALSASSYAGGISGNCSRSIDCGNLTSGSSLHGDSLLTPPSSPVPRPASVTVIKQEGGACTFLSSHHMSGQYKQSSFSPLSSSVASPSSVRLHEANSRSWCHSGLSATKRSLSFSDDFEHRESIEYTPTSTPEFERRFDQDSKRGGLLRCQSHPSDLNLKYGKGRRKTRLCHNRPTLDFAKMSKTSLSKRNRCKERTYSGSKNSFSHVSNSWASLPSDLSQVSATKLSFPSIISTESSPKKNILKLQPVQSRSPTLSFSIGCSKPLGDIRRRIPSPADEIATDNEEDAVADVVTAPGGVVSSFVRECCDLDVNEIENETDDEMKTL